MKQYTHEDRSSADLAVLSGATMGQRPEPSRDHGSGDIDDPERAARVSELKAQYQAGTLSVDAGAIAAKLVDSHIQEHRPNSRSSSHEK